MKSALPQQAPTPIKMKSVTLLNKQEKLFTNNIERAFIACCFLRMLERINRIHIDRIKNLLEFSINKARVGALTFFGLLKSSIFKLVKTHPLFQSE